MSNSKFSTRKEAYDHTIRLLATRKNTRAIVSDYSHILDKQPTLRPTVQMIGSRDVMLYKAFEYTVGNTPVDVMTIHENGVIDI